MSLAINTSVNPYANHVNNHNNRTTTSTTNQAASQTQADSVEVSPEARNLQNTTPVSNTPTAPPTQANSPLCAATVFNMAREQQATMRITSEMHGHADRPAFYNANSLNLRSFAIQQLGITDWNAVNAFEQEIMQNLRGNEATRLATVTTLEHLALTHFDNEQDAARFLAGVYAAEANGRLHTEGWQVSNRQQVDSNGALMNISPPMRDGEVIHSNTGRIVQMSELDAVSAEYLGRELTPGNREHSGHIRTEWELEHAARETEATRSLFGTMNLHSQPWHFQANLINLLFGDGQHEAADSITRLFEMLESEQRNEYIPPVEDTDYELSETSNIPVASNPIMQILSTHNLN